MAKHPHDSPRRAAVTQMIASKDAPTSARSRQLRALMLGTGVAALLIADAFAVPLPKPRPIPRSVIPQTSAPVTAPSTGALVAPGPNANVAAAPPPTPKKQSAPLAMSQTSSTSKADSDTLEEVIELVRKNKPADATQLEAAIAARADIAFIRKSKTRTQRRAQDGVIILAGKGRGSARDRDLFHRLGRPCIWVF